MPPAEPGSLRDDWQQRAGIVGAYRAAAGITDPEQAIGPVPSGKADLAEAFRASVRALELPDEAALLKAMNQGQLEARVQEYMRAEAIAPADVQAEVGDREHSLAEARARVSAAQLAGDVAAAEAAEAEAADHAKDLARLSVADAARREWLEAAADAGDGGPRGGGGTPATRPGGADPGHRRRDGDAAARGGRPAKIRRSTRWTRRGGRPSRPPVSRPTGKPTPRRWRGSPRSPRPRWTPRPREPREDPAIDPADAAGEGRTPGQTGKPTPRRWRGRGQTAECARPAGRAQPARHDPGRWEAEAEKALLTPERAAYEADMAEIRAGTERVGELVDQMPDREAERHAELERELVNEPTAPQVEAEPSLEPSWEPGEVSGPAEVGAEVEVELEI